MKNWIIVFVIMFVTNPLKAQERESAQRIDFLVKNEYRLKSAVGWSLNNKGDWIKNQNIMSDDYEDIRKDIPSSFNFKEFYFNKFEYKNEIYYCLILDKFQKQGSYYSYYRQETEIHFFIFGAEEYLSMVSFVNSKTQGIKIISPFVVGKIYEYDSGKDYDRYLRYEITKNIDSRFEITESEKEYEFRNWELYGGLRRKHKTFDNYFKTVIEKKYIRNLNNKIMQSSFAVNYQILNDNEIIRFLLPFDNIYTPTEAEVRTLFTNKYFEVPRDEFVKIIID